MENIPNLFDMTQFAWTHDETEADYAALVGHYEQAIETDPEQSKNYWYLGLAHLLDNQEEEAQGVWLYGLSLFDAESVITELAEILEQEAQHQHPKDLYKSWLIRQHLRTLLPENIKNLFYLVELSADLDELNEETLEEFNLSEILKDGSSLTLDAIHLNTVLDIILNYPSEKSIRFVRACIPYFRSNLGALLQRLISTATFQGYEKKQFHYAIDLTQIYLDLQPNSLAALEHLPRFYLEVRNYSQAIAAAEQFCAVCEDSLLKIIGYSMLLRTLMTSGNWLRVPNVVEQNKKNVRELINQESTNLSLEVLQSTLVYTGLFAYVQDNLSENRWFHNSIGQLLDKNLKANAQVDFPLFLPTVRQSGEKLKVGYVGHTLRSHSVGWLSRWLFKHHDRKQLDISVYLFNQTTDDPFFQNWIAPHVDWAGGFGNDIPALAEKIRDDKIQVLVDLDSITLDYTSMAMALKPAPVQVTWLGWDASGVQSIDYFVADPYVLPDDAQEHYSEKIWRLPQTYLAVEGFEVDVPTLRREDLNISFDAIVYLSSQAGMKRNPYTIRLQMQILRKVPNSYLLIKGLADQAFIQNLFSQIAQEEGVSSDRLRFLPLVANEYMHRANLSIADVVLDTYPYNGATTTLETIWMGIPIVTRVGSTFAARNSYTFLHNAGISDGIAWSDEEYVNWGIRFGRDEPLRHKVAWQMYQSRSSAPLWNVKRFAHEMENAYQQMWQHYCATT
jgi:predicted O-linked N-acetylglucosamine transferase (SPINDLY family)